MDQSNILLDNQQQQLFANTQQRPFKRIFGAFEKKRSLISFGKLNLRTTTFEINKTTNNQFFAAQTQNQQRRNSSIIISGDSKQQKTTFSYVRLYGDELSPIEQQTTKFIVQDQQQDSSKVIFSKTTKDELSISKTKTYNSNKPVKQQEFSTSAEVKHKRKAGLSQPIFQG